MFIFPYLYDLLKSLTDVNLPGESQVAISLLILITISMLCVMNIIFYFVVLIVLDKEYIQNWLNEKNWNWPILLRIIKIYKNTSIYFLLFEISLFLYINVVIIFNCYKIISLFSTLT